MNKIKIISANSIEYLEKNIDKWQKSSNYEILSTSLTHSGANYVISIVYNELPLTL